MSDCRIGVDPTGADAPAAGADAPATGAREPEGGPGLNRRAALKLLSVLPLAPVVVPAAGLGESLDWTRPEVAQAAARSASLEPEQQGGPYTPRFFTPHEYATVRVLVDMVIPADQKSGSATDARVPEFMDFMMTDGGEARRVAMRGGLAWLDEESRKRFARTFVAATAAQRAGILDDIAWPKKARPELSHGVAFFNRFRDLTAAGFFSSEMGHRDLGFQGNVPVLEWKGCGDAANAHALRAPGANSASE